jgi:glutaminyl-peptide cyclotransferase
MGRGMRTRRPLLLVAAIVVLAGCGLAVAAVSGAFDSGDGAAARAARVNRFDGARAWAELRRQVELGPRPAGSATLRALARRIRDRLPHGRFERIPGHPGLRNVVGHVAGTRPAVVVAAHYDTKELPGFVGANDGAGGTAALLELARVLRHAKRPAGAPELRFVFFDGEENPDASTRSFYAGGVRGSKAYARRHAKDVEAVVLLDFVADRHLSIPREAGSDAALWERLRAAARRAGTLSTFPTGTASTVLDDHTPFTRRGIPAIDLIDFDYPCWHETCDDLAHVSRRSLDRSGETVLELLRTWR